MAHRTISTAPNGNVKVFTHVAGTTAIEEREYKRRGRLVYMLREGLPPQPMCRGLRTHGKPLFLRPGEKLEEAVREALAERESVRGAVAPAFKLAMVLLLCALAVAAWNGWLGNLTALWAR